MDYCLHGTKLPTHRLTGHESCAHGKYLRQPTGLAPGRGLLVIALALSVFAVEYRCARRYLAAVQARARSAALKAAASRVATTCTVLFGIGALGLGAVLICADLLPFSGAGTGLGVAIGGLTVLATMAYGIRESRRTD